MKQQQGNFRRGQQQMSPRYGGGNSSNGRPLGLSPHAWPTLQQSSRPHHNSGMRAVFLQYPSTEGKCSGTGVFLPRPVGAPRILVSLLGDVIPVPLGVVSWWFNGGDSETVMVFLGDTTKAYVPGQFTYFFLTGGLGFLNGFSTQLISKTYNLTGKQSESLTKNQTAFLIIKLGDDITMPKPNVDDYDHKLNFFSIKDDMTIVKEAGTISSFTSDKFPLLEQIGLSANYIKLENNAILAPKFAPDSSVEVVYVVRGGGRVEIVGINGQFALDAEVKQGELFVVPKFFVSALVANEDGMDLFTVMTSSQPVIENLAGTTSVLNAISPVVLQASLDVTQEFEQLFKSKLGSSKLLIIPKNN